MHCYVIYKMKSDTRHDVLLKVLQAILSQENSFYAYIGVELNKLADTIRKRGNKEGENKYGSATYQSWNKQYNEEKLGEMAERMG